MRKFLPSRIATVAMFWCVLASATPYKPHGRSAVNDSVIASVEYVVKLKESPSSAQATNGQRYADTRNAFRAELVGIDPQATIIWQPRLLPQYVVVRVQPTTVTRLRTLSMVAGIGTSMRAARDLTPSAGARRGDVGTNALNVAPAKRAAGVNALGMRGGVGASRTAIASVSADPQAGKGVRVAIISTGVDYTHASLGGPGTRAAYEEALANGLASYEGFPTAVVVGGMDFQSDSPNGLGLVDRNPIDQDLKWARSYDSYVYPTGRGTFLASVVHAIAPGAGIVAYKVSNVVVNKGVVTGAPADIVAVGRAVEHAIDPNGDGDYSDRVNVILLEDALGSFAYYSPESDAPSPDYLLYRVVESAVTHGVLVVCNSGNLIIDSPYSIATLGSAPDVLTVGGSQKTDAVQIVAPFSGHGPVRGQTTFLKPEMVADAANIVGATVGSGSGTEERTNLDVAAARIAGIAAIVKSARPTLSLHELKAAIVNTATRDILHTSSIPNELADVTRAGVGRDNVDAALKTPIVAWDADNHTPSVYWGFREVKGIERVVRYLEVRNLSDQDQSYALSHQTIRTKAGYGALRFEYPTHVQVPAHRSVTVPVVLNIDGARLPPWPLTETETYTREAWASVELNGYFVLTQAGLPDVAVSWLVMARAKTSITKRFDTTRESYSSPFAAWFSSDTGELTQRFRNESSSMGTFALYPVIRRVDHIETGREAYDGHLIRYVGGGVYDEPRCTVTGRKLSIALSFWRPAQVALANYFEKIGTPLVYWELYPQSVVKEWGVDVTIDNLPFDRPDASYVTRGWIELNAEGQPVTVFPDLNLPPDIDDPNARLRVSKLPAQMSSHTRVAVAELCLEEIFHDSIDGPSKLDENLGWVVATDRDVVPRIHTPIIQFNPTAHSYVITNGNDGTRLPLGGDAVFRVGPENALQSVSKIQLAPGEEATVSAFKDGRCFWLPPGVGASACDAGFILLNLTNDYALYSEVGYPSQQVLASPIVGQQLSLREDATNGAVVGRVELDAEGFFGIGDVSRDYKLRLAEAVPGDPFTLMPNGDVVVSNALGIDYEVTRSFTLRVYGAQGDARSAAVDVRIDVGNVNDNEPRLIGTLKALPNGATQTPYSASLANEYEDADGDLLTYAATALPAGLTIDAETGKISGTPTAVGTFAVKISVTDGVHDAVTATLPLTVRATETNISSPTQSRRGGGGALGVLPLVVLAITWLRRRFELSLRATRMSVTLLVIAVTVAVAVPTLAVVSKAKSSNPSVIRSAPRAQKSAPSKWVSYLSDGTHRRLYFVHLKAAPLASYSGGVSGLAATSLKATARKNVNAFGTLNVRSARSSAYLSWLSAQQSQSLQAASRRLGRPVAAREQFKVALNAYTTYLTDKEAERLRTVDSVRAVELVTPRVLRTDRGPTLIGAPQVWSGEVGLPTRGEGIIVGIIDTGIWPTSSSFADVGGDGYDHVNPLGAGTYLGDCQTDPGLCNDKLIGIVSYPEVTSSFADVRVPVGVDHNGHGSHVASTAAGNVLLNVQSWAAGQAGAFRFPRISGVAPHANIVSYQVCTPHEGGGCYPDLTVRAVENAIQNGVKVLNYSIGGPADSPWVGADALAFLAAREAGIHVASAAGNEGPGAQTIDGPGNAPWLTGVAASTHDRGFTSKGLSGFIGGAHPPVTTLLGEAATAGYTGSVVYAGDYGDALCAQPFAPGTFSGQIVVCDRGQNARVAKGANVLAGGAGGLILVNVSGGDSGLFADFHALPAIHLDVAEGNVVKNWLAEGVGHVATIGAAEYRVSSEKADVVADFSSRGPGTPIPLWVKPDVAAPGVDVFAAYTEDSLNTASYSAPFEVLSGTSMATPHVAGALALLAALHPEWTPAEAQSALVSTAEKSVRNSNGAAAGIFDTGAGRIRVAEAAKAALVLDETAANYSAANPDTGGDPTRLNLPSLAKQRCVLECKWTRTVRAVRAGSWTAVGTSSNPLLKISAEPETFALGVGESTTIAVTARALDTIPGDWATGAIELHSLSSDIPDAHWPVAAQIVSVAVPEYTRIETSLNRSTYRINGLNSATATPKAFSWGVGIARRYEGSTIPDPTPTNWWNKSTESLQVIPVEVTTRTRMLIARVVGATAPDVDLYIGRDTNVNGRVDYDEVDSLLCVSGGTDSNEECRIADPKPATYWIAVHNFQGSGAPLDTHALLVAQVRSDQTGFSVTVPTTVTQNPFGIDVNWDAPLVAGDTAFALYSFGGDANHAGTVGAGLVEFARLPDEFSVSADKTDVLSGMPLGYTLHFSDNQSTTSRRYEIDVNLPQRLTVTSAEGAPQISGSKLHWSVEQAPSSTERSLRLALDTSQVRQSETNQLLFAYSVNNGTANSAAAPQVFIEGLPVARIENSATFETAAKPGENIKFSIAGTAPARSTDTLTYNWRQLSGPTAAIAGSATGYLIVVPSVIEASTTMKYELTVSNGRRVSDPAQLSINVSASAAPAKSGGGGVLDLWWLAFAAILLATRALKKT